MARRRLALSPQRLEGVIMSAIFTSEPMRPVGLGSGRRGILRQRRIAALMNVNRRRRGRAILLSGEDRKEEEEMRSLVAACAMAVSVAPMEVGAGSIGEAEYGNSCAACHGAEGKGDGPLKGHLSTEVPDLTQLSARNGGVFPVAKVYATIDGTMMAGPHGTREMPVWGHRYGARGASGANPDYRVEETEVFVRFRILALTEYLAGIQE